LLFQSAQHSVSERFDRLLSEEEKTLTAIVKYAHRLVCVAAYRPAVVQYFDINDILIA